MPTPLRRFRCPDDLWAQASERARAEGTSVSEVVVAYLRRYVGQPVPTAARAPSVRGTEKGTEKHPYDPNEHGKCKTCGKGRMAHDA